MSKNILQQLSSIQRAQKALDVNKYVLLEKAMKSTNPNEILGAAEFLKTLEPRQETEPKSYFIDPLQFTQSLGYKDKPYSLTYTTLSRMSRTPIINAIIKTRKNQVADFCEPQKDAYSTGFEIRRKTPIGEFSKVKKLDKQDQKIAHHITDFLLNGGEKNSWDSEDFDAFTRKVIEDSLTYDQMTWENIENRRGQLTRFLATDASTFRYAESFYKNEYDNPYFKRNGVYQPDYDKTFGKPVKGYYPAYVQVYQNRKVNDFYPWELCFAVRNPTTSVTANGYGFSELEDLINVVTSLLWGDEYNRKFFSQGSAPKGFFRFKGPVNEASLQQFKQQWQAMITGVMQSWKTPVLEGDVDWFDMQKNNRDMEYTSWIEYLIKIACAIYSIDPSEIGWDISRSSGSRGMFESGQQERLQHSKDKGLYPLLKFYQRKLNKYIVERLHPDFELVFKGLDGLTLDQELDMDIKKVKAFVTINETREKYDMKPIENGDIISDSVYAQQLAREAMKDMGQPGIGGNPAETGTPVDAGDEPNIFDVLANESDEQSGEASEKAEDDVFAKAFEEFMNSEDNE